MNKFAHTFLALSVLALLVSGCARTAAVPEDPTDPSWTDPSDPSNKNALPVDDPNVTSPQTSNSQSEADCIAAAQAACDAAFTTCKSDAGSNANKITICNETKANCEKAYNKPIAEGGCKPMTLPAERGDPIPVCKVGVDGCKKMKGHFTHCTNKEDALTIRNGILSFVTQRGGGGTRDVAISPDPIVPFPKPEVNFISERTYSFATVGKAAEKESQSGAITPTSDTKNIITLDLEDDNHDPYKWLEPGAYGFALGPKLKNADLTRPIYFHATAIEKKGEEQDRDNKYAYVVNQNDWWGVGQSQMAIIYGKSDYYWKKWPEWWFNWIYVLKPANTNCEFKTDFEVFYYEKSL